MGSLQKRQTVERGKNERWLSKLEMEEVETVTIFLN